LDNHSLSCGIQNSPLLSQTQKSKIKKILETITTGQEWIADNIQYLFVSGSHLYGTNTDSSDLDIRGVTIAPIEYWIGNQKFEQFICQHEDIDITIFDLRKFLFLCEQANPNIAEFLFAKPTEIFCTPAFQSLVLDNHSYFVSEKARHTFGGYATSQLHKLLIKQENKTGRQDRIEEHGLDTKFLSHLFRLVYSGKEILETGRIQFPMPTAQKLLDIKLGKVYNKNLGTAAQAVEDAKLAVKELESCVANVPYSANHVKIGQIQIQYFKEFHAKFFNQDK
jgi:predicted nucleotidyltransferase